MVKSHWNHPFDAWISVKSRLYRLIETWLDPVTAAKIQVLGGAPRMERKSMACGWGCLLDQLIFSDVFEISGCRSF